MKDPSFLYLIGNFQKVIVLSTKVTDHVKSFFQTDKKTIHKEWMKPYNKRKIVIGKNEI